ncbi:MAG: branched-chain amino acid ABC transporter substrate-binding protein, partial [Methylocella sp.]
MIFKHGSLAAFFGVALSASAIPAVAADNVNVKVGFVRAPHMRETLSILDIPAADDGIAGAELAVDDNNTTGQFLGQTFAIEDVLLGPGDEPAAALNGLIARGVSFVLADLPATALLALADAAKGTGVLI